MLTPFTLREDWASEMLTMLESEWKDLVTTARTVVDEKQSEIVKIGVKTQRLVEAYLEQLLDREMFASQNRNDSVGVWWCCGLRLWLAVWRCYNGRGDSENRIRELGADFGVKGFCCRGFWATQAACQLAIWAYNLCVLLQRELGLLKKAELKTLRWRLFCRAGVWSRSQGRPTLKLAVHGEQERNWWTQVLAKLRSKLPPLNCDAVEFSPI